MKVRKYKIEAYVTENVKGKVCLKAAELGTSIAEIIKRALEEYLK